MDAGVKDVITEPFPITFVQDLETPAEYHNDYQCLSITSKKAADGGWTIPYANHLAVKEGATVVLDCGFFDKHHDGWRVAYCLDGDTRKPRRLYFLKQGDELAVQVDEQTQDRTMRIYTGFKNGKCRD